MKEKEYTRDEVIEMLKHIAEKLKTQNIPRSTFLRETGISERRLQQLFDGSYNNLVIAAGLEPRFFPPKGEKLYSDEDLLDEVERVLRIPESKLSRLFFDQNAKVSSSVCDRRFGGWINTLKIIAKRFDVSNDKEIFIRIKEYTGANDITKPLIENNEIENEEYKDENEEYHGSNVDSSNIYGDFINFRGLQHAPVNEQGVVFLFGMICREIGYVVEIVRQGFPDCEAKRKIVNKPGKWQKVRIEFEFQSRSFRSHGHDPNMCDLIVCWENNWKECPIEVIELQDVIKKLAVSV
jgi:hypothetical protein